MKRYVYVDEQNRPLFRVCRTQSKTFFQERYEKGKWILGLDGTRRVLYRLPEVLKAETVSFVEGEKDADKLQSIGLTATTNPAGAGKWDDSYNDALRGRDIIVIPDNDQSGQEHALKVAKSVLRVAKSAKLVSLPGVPDKGDVSDYLMTHTKEDLIRLVDQAPPFAADADKKGQSKFWPEFLTAAQILSLPPDPTRYVLDQTLPFSSASVFVSKPKLGKTTTATNLTIAISRGLPFLGRNTIQCPVAYLSLDASLPEISETFMHFGLRETDPVFIHAGAAPRDAIAWLTQRIKENSVRFVVVDTLQRLFRFQNLNDYSEVTNTLEPLLEAVREQNAHVMFLHHAKKEAGDDLDSAIGSTAIRGLAYTYLHLKKLPNSERRILRSDQRGGKNFPETAIKFSKSNGWLEMCGSMEDAEIEEAEPQITELLQTEGGDVLEKTICANLKIRAFIVSKALRKLFRDGKVNRVGKGRKGSPFHYSVMATLLDSLPGIGGMGGRGMGRESKNQANIGENTGEMLFPKTREENGKRMEENPKTGGSGIESNDIIVEWEETL